MFKTIINNIINNDMVQAVVEGAGKGLEIGGKVVVGTAAVTAPILVPGGQAAVTAKTVVQGAACIAAGKGMQKGVEKVQGKNNNTGKSSAYIKQYKKSDVDPELLEVCTEVVVELLAKGKRDLAIDVIYNDMYTDMWSPGLRKINARNFVDSVEATYADVIEEMFVKMNNIKNK